MIKFRKQFASLALSLGVLISAISVPVWADDAVSCQQLTQSPIDFSRWPEVLGSDFSSIVNQAPEFLPILSRLELAIRTPMTVKNALTAGGVRRKLVRALTTAAEEIRSTLQSRDEGLFPLPKEARHFISKQAIFAESRARIFSQPDDPEKAKAGLPVDYRGLEILRGQFRSQLVERLVAYFAPGLIEQGDYANLSLGQIDVVDQGGRRWLEVKSGGNFQPDTVEQLVDQAQRYLNDRHRANMRLPDHKAVHEVGFVFLNRIPPTAHRRLVMHGVEVLVLAPY